MTSNYDVKLRKRNLFDRASAMQTTDCRACSPMATLAVVEFPEENTVEFIEMRRMRLGRGRREPQIGEEVMIDYQPGMCCPGKVLALGGRSWP